MSEARRCKELHKCICVRACTCLCEASLSRIYHLAKRVATHAIKSALHMFHARLRSQCGLGACLSRGAAGKHQAACQLEIGHSVPALGMAA